MEKLNIIHSKKSKFIFSLISSIFYLLGIATIVTMSNFNVYFLSYIHIYQDSASLAYGNGLLAFFTFSAQSFAALSGIVESYVGPRIAILLSTIVIELSAFGFLIQKNIIIFYLLILSFGIGNGLSSGITMKNACFYYPEHKGVITSIILGCTVLASAVCTAVGEYVLINPGNIPCEESGYYKDEIALRSKYYLYFILITMPVCSFFCELFFFKYNENDYIELERESDLNQIIPKSEDSCKDLEGNDSDINEKTSNNKEHLISSCPEEIKPDKISQNELIDNKNNICNNKDNEKVDEIIPIKDVNNKNDNKNLTKGCNIIKIVICNKRLWIITTYFSICPFAISFITFSFRTYINIVKGFKQGIKGIMMGGLMVFVCISGPFWAFLVDKKGFVKATKIMAILSALIFCLFTIFIQNNVFYIILVLCNSILAGGVMCLLNPHVMHVYGIQNFLYVGGTIKFLEGFFKVLTAFINVALTKNRTEEQLIKNYRIVCGIGIALSILGFFVGYIENDEKFDFTKYDNKIKDEKDEKASIDKIEGNLTDNKK